MEIIAWVLVGVLLAMGVTRFRSGNRRRRRATGEMPVFAMHTDGVCCCVPPHPHHRQR
jgi:hypothetical protein